ncbi:MAG: hypothetical protein H7Y61_11275 [Rhizobiales bacterium]|nr:hypothetical protein [Rhizobacter sp.]
MTATTLNPIDLQNGLSLQHAAATGLTAHEHVGFELGWDYAHYRVTLPVPYSHEPSPLRNGLLAGQSAFGTRTLNPTRHVRKWLQLRLHAWLRGRSVELVQVTPNYLQQIDASHCPITRVVLSSATLEATDASIDRVRNDAGYAAGNLAVMSTKANHAKGAHGFRDAIGFVQQIEAEQLPGMGGLTGEQWARAATLCSFVEPLSHQEACALPLLVLPPNRLRLFNPVQALQAFVSQQLLKPGWSQRISRFEDLLPGKALRRDFKSFFMSLLPRVIEGGRSGDASHARWAVEDAWRASLVQQRWSRFARQLSAAQCESLLARAAARKLSTGVMMPLTDAGATDGWNLATRGYVPHAENTARAREAQQQFAW